MAMTHNVFVDDNSAYMELDSMLNEAWANGYIDGYVSVIRKELNYSEHREYYEGRMLEEYECGYLSAIQDDVKWTRKCAWARGYVDGYRASKLEWEVFDFFAFWMSEYSGEIHKRYDVGYSDGFLSGFCKQKDYEWSLGFVNRLRNYLPYGNTPWVSLSAKNFHDDHGYLRYPLLYEEGYEAAKNVDLYCSLTEAERFIGLSHKRCWTIGFIDGMHNRNNRFDTLTANCQKKVFRELSIEYESGYKAGIFTFWNKDVEMTELESYSDNKDFVEGYRKQRREEHIWGTGYIDGRLCGKLRYKGYNEDEYNIYKDGYDVGYVVQQKQAIEKNEDEEVTVSEAEHKGMIDALHYNHLVDHGFDRIRFHAYRKGFYEEKEFQFKSDFGWDANENSHNIILDFLKSFQIPNTCAYINNKLDAWKLGVKSGFTGNSEHPNNNIFFGNKYEMLSDLNVNHYLYNTLELDLFEAYKDGCIYGYEHTFKYRWDFAYDIGYSDGEDYAFDETNVHDESRNNFKGFELEAYDKGFSDALKSVYNAMNDEDNSEDSSYEWTKEDAWDAMTDGMYGDYKGDVDFDIFGL